MRGKAEEKEAPTKNFCISYHAAYVTTDDQLSLCPSASTTGTVDSALQCYVQSAYISPNPKDQACLSPFFVFLLYSQ